MHSCEKVIQGIWEYLDREMENGELSEIQKHLDLCRACFSRIEFERMLREHMRKATHHTCPEKLKEKIRKIVDKF